MDTFISAFSELLTPTYFLKVLQIIWIDLLLSGDNAVVIAMACRSLPENQRKIGMFAGAGAAVGLRILFAFVFSYLITQVPYLKFGGGLLLFWIAFKLLIDHHDDAHDVKGSTTLWGAVMTIALADAVMSLDNVVAIVAAAGGHCSLFVFGLLLSIPLIVSGSALLLNIIRRFPVFIWAGAALLGWIAAEMIVGDREFLKFLGSPWYTVKAVAGGTATLEPVALLHYGAGVAGALAIIVAGCVRRQLAARGAPA
ncbi:MAG: TerC family protein [Methylobacteriaceae bacterium]|jgi:YjbE family integral membrane protein|nr:TerC family protein [Methylobacteriaceae bacterium]